MVRNVYMILYIKVKNRTTYSQIDYSLPYNAVFGYWLDDSGIKYYIIDALVGDDVPSRSSDLNSHS